MSNSVAYINNFHSTASFIMYLVEWLDNRVLHKTGE